MASVRLTPIQEKKIKEQNISKSEFIRRAVDYYLIYLESPYNSRLLDELEMWIKLKRNTDVLHDNTSVLNNNTSVLQMNTDVPDNNTNVLICNTENTAKTQNTQNNTNQDIKTKLAEELPMLQRLLNNPENNQSIPDYTLKLLYKKYDISKSTIQTWITENKEWIKEGKFHE